MQNFSERLAHAIKIAGKPKGDLANHCGVALSSVSRWLGGTVPRAEVALEIAQFLGVNVNWLIYGSDNLSNAPNEATRLPEDVAEYGKAMPLIQPVSEAVKRASADDLWERIACTSSGIAQISEPKMRLKISGDLIIMIESAIAKDQKTVREKEL